MCRRVDGGPDVLLTSKEGDSLELSTSSGAGWGPQARMAKLPKKKWLN